MEPSCCSSARLRPWRVFECFLFLIGIAGLGLYAVGCQMPITWKGVIGPQHWAEVFVEDGDLDLLFMRLQDQDCLQALVGYATWTGFSVLHDDGDCGCGYRHFQRPAIVFITPDWLYDRCDSLHPPTSSLILRIPLAFSSLFILGAPLAVRTILAGRKFVRHAGFRCGECGYPLQGLPVLRCPECGQL